MVNFCYYFTVKKQLQRALYSIYEAAVNFSNHGQANNVYRVTNHLELL